jgi:hypothetical protein
MTAEAAACSHRQPLKKDQRACSGCLRLPIPSPSAIDGHFFQTAAKKILSYQKNSFHRQSNLMNLSP